MPMTADRAATSSPTRSWPRSTVDTQAYLQLLLEGGADGLGGNGEELAAVLRASSRPRATSPRSTAGSPQRRANIERSITNFRRAQRGAGRADTQLGAFVDSSNAVLESFANQEAAIRGTLQELPTALAATRGALESGNAPGPGARAGQRRR